MVVPVILLRNVHLHHAKAEVEVVVDGIITDGVEDAVEEEEGDVQVPKGHLMPH